MEWNKLKEQYIEVIQKELEETKPTIDAYQYLVSQGYDQDEAIASICVYFHMMTMELLQKKKEYDEKEWSDILKPLYMPRTGKKLNKGQLTSQLRRIEKEIGVIEAGSEEDYLDGLMYYEGQILTFSRYYGLHSGDIAHILKAWIVKLYADYTNQSFNLLGCMDAELDEMASLLEKDGNPYYNKALAQSMKNEDKELDFDSKEVKDNFYQSGIQCLQRILISVDFWNKELGHDGYLRYLEEVFTKDDE